MKSILFVDFIYYVLVYTELNRFLALKHRNIQQNEIISLWKTSRKKNMKQYINNLVNIIKILCSVYTVLCGRICM